MIISEHGKFCVLSNPKCGTSTIEEMVSRLITIPIKRFRKNLSQVDYDSHHYKHVATRFVAADVPDWDDYFSFTTIRNPWDRMVSWWRWLLKSNRKILKGDHSFEYFLDYFENEHLPKAGGANIDWFAFDEHGNQLVKEIIKLEDIKEEWPRISQKLKLKDGSLLHQKKTRDIERRKADMEAQYTPALIKKVERLFESDIEIGKYSF